MQSNLAEDVRFELTDHFWSLVFKTSAIDRSANLPYCGGMCWIRTSWPITDHDFTDRYSRQCCSHSIVVSEKGFGPSTSWSQIKCSAKLSYSENHFKFNIKSLYITLYLMSNFIYIILFCCNWKNIWSVYVLNFYTYSPHNYDHKLFGSFVQS